MKPSIVVVIGLLAIAHRRGRSASAIGGAIQALGSGARGLGACRASTVEPRSLMHRSLHNRRRSCARRPWHQFELLGECRRPERPFRYEACHPTRLRPLFRRI